MKFNRGIIAGAFDLIHPGYVRMFKEAKELCNFLTVALHANPALERPEKFPPVQSVLEREEILLSIKYIDDVVFYETEEGLVEVLKTGKYDLRILGNDYLNKVYTGDFLKIPIYYIERNHEYSTSSLKLKIIQSVNDEKKISFP